MENKDLESWLKLDLNELGDWLKTETEYLSKYNKYLSNQEALIINNDEGDELCAIFYDDITYNAMGKLIEKQLKRTIKVIKTAIMIKLKECGY